MGSAASARHLGSLCYPWFFSCCHDRVGTDVQHPCGVTHATRIESHRDNLLFDRRRLAWIAIVQQEGATSTASLVAPVPLLALPGLAMADNIRTVAVGTVQDLENHDGTQSRWGCSAAETLIEKSTSTPVRHLPMFKVPNEYHIREGELGSTDEIGNSGAFLIPYQSFTFRVIASDGMGWEHVSVSLPNRCPRRWWGKKQ